MDMRSWGPIMKQRGTHVSRISCRMRQGGNRREKGDQSEAYCQITLHGSTPKYKTIYVSDDPGYPADSKTFHELRTEPPGSNKRFGCR